MSQSSFASFHLTGYKNNKLMNTSVDRLFENDGDVFLSSSYADFQQLPAILETSPKPQPPPRVRGRSRSPDKKGSTSGAISSAASTPEHRGRESPATARSSRRDSLTEKPVVPSGTTVVLTGADTAVDHQRGFDGDLLKEFQRQKQRLQETLQVKEREREELLRQLQSTDNRLQDNR
jgi:hypothetical protein